MTATVPGFIRLRALWRCRVEGPDPNPTATGRRAMHYPRRVSKIKRVRKLGFRARMKTRLGRKMINRKRRMGRRLSAV